MSKHGAEILAITWGWDISDVKDYRYHYGRTRKPIFALSDGYYCVSNTKPTDDMGNDWELAKDQTIAHANNTFIWIAPLTKREKASELILPITNATMESDTEHDIPTHVHTPTIAPIFTIDDTGCYADCSRGQYIGCVVIELAADHGFKVFCEDTGVPESPFNWFSVWQDNEERFTSLYHSEWEDFCVSDFMGDYMEIWEDAENFLNDLCDDSVWFGCTESGDWGLWEVDTEEEEDEDNDNE